MIDSLTPRFSDLLQGAIYDYIIRPPYHMRSQFLDEKIRSYNRGNVSLQPTGKVQHLTVCRTLTEIHTAPLSNKITALFYFLMLETVLLHGKLNFHPINLLKADL